MIFSLRDSIRHNGIRLFLLGIQDYGKIQVFNITLEMAGFLSLAEPTVNGEVSAFNTIDVQVNYRFQKEHMVIKLGVQIS